MKNEQTSAVENEVLENELDQNPEESAFENEAQEADAETSNEPEAKTTEGSPEEEGWNNKYVRLMADFQNYKRRTEKEKSDIYAYANEKIVCELLDVIDNFERALAFGEGEGLVQGMNNTFKILKGVLEKSGLEEIGALGLEFDPTVHNAVMTEDSTEHDSNKVTAVLQKGYKLNGKTIRPSMVKVSN